MYIPNGCVAVRYRTQRPNRRACNPGGALAQRLVFRHASACGSARFRPEADGFPEAS